MFSDPLLGFLAGSEDRQLALDIGMDVTAKPDGPKDFQNFVLLPQSPSKLRIASRSRPNSLGKVPGEGLALACRFLRHHTSLDLQRIC